MSLSTPSALDMAQTFFTALEDHNLALVAPVLAEDVTESIPLSNTGSAEPWSYLEGKEAVMGYLGTIVQNFSRVVLADKEYSITEGGDTVFVEAKGDLIYAETGDAYNNVYVFKFVTRAGKIISISEYANPITLAKLFGMPIG